MMDDNSLPHSASALNRIAFVGNYLPRQCGIATFTTDLCEAVAAQYPTTCFSVPVNDTESGYSYPPRVRFELVEKDLDSYRRAADFLNVNNVDLVSLQHEYGIYGGQAGSHILALLNGLRAPIVTTLHTVLRDPDPQQRFVLKEVAKLSDRLVTMSERASEFLREIYGVPAEKISLIPHGIPDIPFVDPNFYKDQFGVAGKTVLLTFGLLSPNKGIENVIAALPAILARFPDVVYIVLGATHPHVKQHEGETYRLSLQRLAHEKGVEDHVIFFNQFVALEELVQFIGAADIYVTPYLNPAQIVSGTLAYALGAGKAVISTPYWYAEEMLADGRGVLVPFRDPGAVAERVIDLLENEPERHAMRKRAYLLGREMVWPAAARRYMECFECARAERLRVSRPAFVVKALDKSPVELPLLNLRHLRLMTDQTGILQHATFTVPNYAEGYAIDDNARALIVAVLLEELGVPPAEEVASLSARYLAFLQYAFNAEAGRFRNFLGYTRRWLEDVGSGDSHGRAIWALGTVLGRSENTAFRALADQLFERALPAILDITTPRSWAFTLLGIHEYLRRFEGDRRVNQIRQELADRLMALYRAHRSAEWAWFEDELTYCNAALPHALLLCGQWIPDDSMVEAGLETLAWLVEVQRGEAGYFVPIGSSGFYPRGGERARFDQQPVEAQTTISACLQAYRLTGDNRWRKEAHRAFQWFLGYNDLNLSLYDPASGGCRDGLHPDRTNDNQGAESTLAFLHALLELRLVEQVFDAEVTFGGENSARRIIQAPQAQSYLNR
jgi:glycosyltransferase involved in cell wall biosynthesis